MRRPRLLALLLALALFGAGCGSSSDEVTANPAADEAETAATIEPEPTATPEPEPTEEPAPAVAAPPEPTEQPVAEPAAAAPFDITADGCEAEVAPGYKTIEFEFEDRARTYEVQVPKSYASGTPLPVVLNWHGLGSNGTQQLGFSDYLPLAERENFLVVGPTGVPSPGDADGRNSWELTPDADPTRDDVAFANYVLDHVIASYCVDQDRVYSTGMSNGGYFTSVLICEMGDRIAAGASVGALTFDDSCSPSRAVPYIGFHGVDDLVVPYAGGGESSLAPGQTIELFERKIVDEFDQFADAYGCADDPVLEQLTDDVTAYTYPTCTVEMTFYEVANSGHTWPGSSLGPLTEGLGLGVTTTDINASETSWEFFSRHSLSG